MRAHPSLPLLIALAAGPCVAGAQEPVPATAPAPPAAPAPAVAPAPVAAAAPAPDTMDFEQARLAANQDEARLDGDQVADLAKAQGDFMKPWVARCTRNVPTRQLTPVGLVMELDAQGNVVRTWQDVHTQVADCLAEGLKAQVFYVPPKTPFITAMDLSWQH